MSYVEDLGLLCEKGYVDFADVNNIIGPGLKQFFRKSVWCKPNGKKTILKIRRVNERRALRLPSYKRLIEAHPMGITGHGA